MADFLKTLVDQSIMVLTNDGRSIQGVLKGYDHTINIVLASACECVCQPTGTNMVELGLYVLRGDNIAVIGEVDEAANAGIDWAGVTGESIHPLTH